MTPDIAATNASPHMGAGFYFDGHSSERHAVTVEIAAAALVIRDAGNAVIATWPYTTLDQIAARDGTLRLGNGDRETLARLDIHDPDFAAAIDAVATSVDRTGAQEKRMRRKVIALSIGALISLASVSLVALPAISARLAPILPVSLERKLGDAVDAQFRTMIGQGHAGLDCGGAPSESAGRAAFEALFLRLVHAANLPGDLRSSVVRSKEVNAVALPGGRIYVFQGLIDKAESADELAGVIAHEIGHVARRDGLRSVLESAGLSFVFGMLLGDFSGGGAVMIATRAVLHASYSRETEAAADSYGVALLNTAGGNAEGLAALLARIEGNRSDALTFLRDHPQTTDRVAAIRRHAAPATALTAATDWAAIKTICSGS